MSRGKDVVVNIGEPRVDCAYLCQGLCRINLVLRLNGRNRRLPSNAYADGGSLRCDTSNQSRCDSRQDDPDQLDDKAKHPQIRG